MSLVAETLDVNETTNELDKAIRLLTKVKSDINTDRQNKLTATLDAINPKLVAIKHDLEDLSDLVPAAELVKDLDEKTVRHIVKELAKLMDKHSIGECT